MRAKRRDRAGITLVELIAVIGIIAVMVSLIVPGIMASRGAADRAACLNHMKQLILALHNYETEHQSLPPGVVDPSRPVRNRPVGLHTSWIAQLLPHLEQGGTAASLDTDYSVYDPVNSGAATKWIATLRCPSDRRNPPVGGVGVTNYAACYHDVEAPIDVDNHGVMFLNSHIRHEDIPDGSGFTIFVGEKPYIGDDLGWISGTSSSLRNTGAPPNANRLEWARGRGPGAGADDLVVGGFGSYHTGGANFAFGDGSVRFVSERIDPGIFRRLGHRDDGEPVSAADIAPTGPRPSR